MQRSTPFSLLLVSAGLVASIGCPSTPFKDDTFLRGEREGAGPCEIAGVSNYLQAAGFLDPTPEGGNAAHWRCIIDPDTDRRPRFDGWEGNTLVINGGSTSLDLEFDLGDDEEGEPLPFENRGVIVGVVGEIGYFYRTASTEEDVLAMELVFSPTISRSFFTIFVAIDSAEGTAAAIQPGQYLEIPIDVITVQSGELQVSLSWDTDADLDLFVTEPDGTRIFYGDPLSESGGQLDLDSNAACQEPFNQNENIFWPPGTAVSGDYRVQIYLYAPCETVGRTNWRVTVLENGWPSTFSGSMNPDDIDAVEVTNIDWTGPE
jgi:hypothetical protein